MELTCVSAGLSGPRRSAAAAVTVGVHATSCARRHDDTDAESGRRPASIDRILHVLRNQRRRRVLVYLSSNSATTRSDLAEHVAPLENGVSVADLTTTQRKRVYVSLHRSHHPTLDEAGALVYDSDRGAVESTPQTAVFLTYLDRVRAPLDAPSRRRHHVPTSRVGPETF